MLLCSVQRARHWHPATHNWPVLRHPQVCREETRVLSCTSSRLHTSLVINRLCYTAPYISASVSQRLPLERVHAGIKIASGVPRRTGTASIYKVMHFAPLRILVTERGLMQFSRLQLTEPNQRILMNLECRPHSTAAVGLKSL